jgi:hypothetical protein
VLEFRVFVKQRRPDRGLSPSTHNAAHLHSRLDLSDLVAISEVGIRNSSTSESHALANTAVHQCETEHNDQSISRDALSPQNPPPSFPNRVEQLLHTCSDLTKLSLPSQLPQHHQRQTNSPNRSASQNPCRTLPNSSRPEPINHTADVERIRQ